LLEETNPDVKRFVKKIADQELAEYRQDMRVYQRYIKENGLSELASSPTKSKKMMKRKQLESEQSKEGAVEASSSPTSRRVSDKEEDSPRIISPSTSAINMKIERQSSQVIV
jgi:Tfp pilus assembly major pilin PilA